MSTSARLKALESAKRDVFPRSVAVMRDGTIRQFCDLAVLQPFLEGEIQHVACDDADIAGLLRALDAQHDVTIEIVSSDGDKLNRERI